jgi:curved DNA-binding protein CbpA
MPIPQEVFTLATQSQARGATSVTYGFEIDPAVILGLEPGASLREIRDAYRLKVSKHHPDHGGDEWAFRIVVRSYEVLSTARVAGRAAQEVVQSSAPGRPAPFHRVPSDPASARPGRRDAGFEPDRMVEIEILSIRFELADPADLVLAPVADRSLSCCLSVRWGGHSGEADARRTQDGLAEAFAALANTSGAAASWSRSEADGFEGWLSYPTATRAHEAFRILHADLNRRGLGVSQWSRDLILPRSGR